MGDIKLHWNFLLLQCLNLKAFNLQWILLILCLNAVWEALVFIFYFFIKITIWCLKQKVVFRILLLLQAKLRLINDYAYDYLVCLITNARKRQQCVPFIWRLVTVTNTVKQHTNMETLDYSWDFKAFKTLMSTSKNILISIQGNLDKTKVKHYLIYKCIKD